MSESGKISSSTTQVHSVELESRWFSSNKMAVEDWALEVIDGPHKGLKVALDRELLLIGRAEWCDLCLSNDRLASKEHAELVLTTKGLLLRDLDSRNGIQINQLQVLQAYVPEGTQIKLGQSTLLLRSQQRQTEIELQFHDGSQTLVGKSPPMRKLFSQFQRLKRRDISVLLFGETGTGKSRIAQTLHQQSEHASGPFVTVNCGALSASLIESLFFGHTQGAFTGANQSHKGYFEQANGGTLFLDEIGELPLELQPRLLDVLERNVVKRLGSEQEHPVDFRLISATHQDLKALIEQGRFRRDLYYRLAVFQMHVPSLRERVEDIPLLAEWLLHDMEPDLHFMVTPAAVRKLQGFLWPGNVRELRNVLMRATAMVDILGDPDALHYLDADDIELPEFVPPIGSPLSESSSQGASAVEQVIPGQITDLKAFMEETEREVLLQALIQHEWNVTRAAKSLSITRAWLHKRINKYDLSEGYSLS